MAAQPNTPPTPPANAQPPAASMSLDDILFTIFRHKWLVLVCCCCGIGAAVVVRAMRPPQFVSHAKLQVHYVEERTPAPGTGAGHLVQLMPAVQGILNVEKEIIRNLDVATVVASNIGPQRLLAKNGGGDDLMHAAGLVCGSVDVEVPQQIPILVVTFRHRDKTLVQPTMNVLIETYLKKHSEMHGFSPELEALYQKQRKELADQFAKTQADLTEILSTNKIINLPDTKTWLQGQTSKYKDQLTEAEVELQTKRAILGESAQAAFTPGSTNAVSVPASVVEEYSRLTARLNHFKQQEDEARLRNPPLTDAHPLMLAIQGQLQQLSNEKIKLLKEHPALDGLPIASTQSSSNSPAASLNLDLAQIKMLSQKVVALSNVVANLDKELIKVLKVESTIGELEMRRNYQATNLEQFAQSLDVEKVTQSLGAGKTVNITTLENPTPPELDRGKMMKLVVGAFGGFVAMGFGLAFLIDFVLDRSIKRPIDIERHLHLKVLQSIPHTAWSNGLRLPWGKNGNRALTTNGNGANGHANTGIALWDPTHHLDAYTMGLSERLMTYFEVNDKNLKKPKLVGFTACARGSGVTTLASGLAASLSRTGNGSVLFVDMNSEAGETQSFYQGKPSVGLTDALEPGDHTEAQIETNLFVATLDDNNSNKLVKAEPRGFSVLMPKIKTSDYDYIIFDLPPVSQTSSSARLAGYMDLTVLVLESEKTGQQAAAKATALMRDARANVATVLNKCKQHVPAALSQDL